MLTSVSENNNVAAVTVRIMSNRLGSGQSHISIFGVDVKFWIIIS